MFPSFVLFFFFTVFFLFLLFLLLFSLLPTRAGPGLGPEILGKSNGNVGAMGMAFRRFDRALRAREIPNQ